MENRTCLFYDFDSFRVDPINRRLTKEGQPIALTPLAFNTLLFLIENKDRLVSRTELLGAIWPDTFVDDTNLAVMISVVRKALGDNGHAQKYIATVAKSGYRFAAEVHKVVDLHKEVSSDAQENAPAHSQIGRTSLVWGAVACAGFLLLFMGMRQPKASTRL